MVKWMYDIACCYILYVAKLALAASKIETCLFIDSIIMTSLKLLFSLSFIFPFLSSCHQKGNPAIYELARAMFPYSISHTVHGVAIL